MIKRVDVTQEAIDVINQLKKRFGELMFHQSGGCCDGSSPMCFEKGEFKIGSSDVKIGEVENCEFFMSISQFEYWEHTHLTLDVTSGRGSSFSIEIPMGIRFIIRSRLYTDEEMKDLEPVVYYES